MWSDSVNKAMCSELIRKAYQLLAKQALHYGKGKRVRTPWTKEQRMGVCLFSCPFLLQDRELNRGPHTCQVSALPLSYIHVLGYRLSLRLNLPSSCLHLWCSWGYRPESPVLASQYTFNMRSQDLIERWTIWVEEKALRRGPGVPIKYTVWRAAMDKRRDQGERQVQAGESYRART